MCLGTLSVPFPFRAREHGTVTQLRGQLSCAAAPPVSSAVRVLPTTRVSRTSRSSHFSLPVGRLSSTFRCNAALWAEGTPAHVDSLICHSLGRPCHESLQHCPLCPKGWATLGYPTTLLPPKALHFPCEQLACWLSRRASIPLAVQNSGKLYPSTLRFPSCHLQGNLTCFLCSMSFRRRRRGRKRTVPPPNTTAGNCF